jgi:hypothetical protein
MPEKMISIPMSLAKLLMADESDMKDLAKFKEAQKVAKHLLKVLVLASK